MTEPVPANKKTITASNSAMLRKTASRLAAVQALYSMDITDTSKDHAALALEFVELFDDAEIDYSEDVKEQSSFARPDPKLLVRIITTVAEKLDDIDALISEHLAAGWSIERLNNIMRAIVRSGVCELVAFPDVPVKVIINEYATVTRSFFSVSEIGFVNGILERIAHKVRAEEMANAKKLS